jgi:hypothetical protein
MTAPTFSGGAIASPGEGSPTMISTPIPPSARTPTGPARRRLRLTAPPVLALGAVLVAGPVLAQASAAPASGPSEIVAVNLIRLLVKQGVITQSAADALIQQAEDEARQARAAAAPPAPATVAQLPPPPADVIRIPYVPQVVRDQIKDDVRKDVMAQAKAEGWATAVPNWLTQVHFFGDLRFRDEYDLYTSNNAPQYVNYSAINASGPIDVNANTNPNGIPYLNTTQNRLNQLSIRARFGATFQPADWVSLTVRLASGQDTAPVTDTQLLGAGLTKKDIWLDQAFITLYRGTYDPRLSRGTADMTMSRETYNTPVPTGSFDTVNFGRVPDLFMHTDLLFDDNLNFDGVLATSDHPLGDGGLRLFGAGGVFPLGYVASGFPTNDSNKVPDHTKWLFAIQAGAQFQPDPAGWAVRGALSFYDFDNVAGLLSAPCPIYSGVKQCSTDSSAPSYMQKGNTLFLIRNILPDPSSPLNYAEPQLAGLAYNYHELDAMAEFEMPVSGDIRGLVTADYVRNLAYDPGKTLASLSPVTNTSGGALGYQSGPNAYNIRLMVGHLRPSEKGDWNFQVGYKYIEPDAVIDAFNSNDYHMGGTNAKGYYLIASYYFAKNTWMDGRWYSSTEVFGQPLAIDVLQLELQTRF